MRKLPMKELIKLVKKHGGWMEGNIARFPTPHNKLMFEMEALAD